jgi:hypothetical protein
MIVESKKSVFFLFVLLESDGKKDSRPYST